MKKFLAYSLLIFTAVIFVSLWLIIAKGYDRQNQVILFVKKIIPSHLARQIKETVFYIPNLKEKNRILKLQVKKYEQGFEGQLFNQSSIKSSNKKIFDLKEFFLPFPRLDLRLGWAATENSKRAHYLEIIDDKILVISGLGQTIYFDKNNINSNKLNQKEIPNNINQLLTQKNYELMGIRDLFYNENYVYISLQHKDNKGFTINIYRAEFNLNNLSFKPFFTTNEYWQNYNVFSGGRIENFIDDKILFSIGFSKDYIAPQNKESLLGKIISIDKNTKKHKLISIGHRNPQGLFFSKKNNLIINSEHGPYGGDEINLNFIEDNSFEKNFGWPISSTGKPYPGEENIFKENNWLSKSHKENGFIEPIKSYTPAIGISELTLKNDSSNKLYVSSLRAGSIYILDFDKKFTKILNEDRIFFKEQRIRDLEYDPEIDTFFALFEYTPSIGIITSQD